MWVYRQITAMKPGRLRGDYTRYEVGYYAVPEGEEYSNVSRFKAVEIYEDREDARESCHYLNGGRPGYGLKARVDERPVADGNEG